MPENASIRIELTGHGGLAQGAAGGGPSPQPSPAAQPPASSPTSTSPTPEGDDIIDAKKVPSPKKTGMPTIPGMPAALTKALPAGATAAAGAAVGVAVIGAGIVATKKMIDNANEVADRLTPYSAAASRVRGIEEANTIIANVSAAQQYEGYLADWERTKGVWGRNWNEMKNAGMAGFSQLVPNTPEELLGGLGVGTAFIKAANRSQGRTGWEATDKLFELIGGISPGLEKIYNRIKGDSEGGDLFTWYMQLEAPDPPADLFGPVEEPGNPLPNATGVAAAIGKAAANPAAAAAGATTSFGAWAGSTTAKLFGGW